MPDETEPTPPAPQPQPSGGAYTQGEKNCQDQRRGRDQELVSRLFDVRDHLARVARCARRLKPSQRRILYAMENLSLFPGTQGTSVREDLGDTSELPPAREAFDLSGRLCTWAQPWRCARSSWMAGQFGSVGKRSAAAMRYTEARLTHLGAGADAGHGEGTRWISSRLR